MGLSLLAVPSLAAPAEAADATSGIDAAAFATPPIEYRPGVRWWWPGNASSQEDLLAQVDYLHDNGFGAVEIVAFAKDFLTGDGTTAGAIYDSEGLGYDTDAILGYESPDYFAKLDAVVAHANELGITVDLNIGSGYLANDDSIDVSDSQSNMALGRATVSVDAAGAITVTSGDIKVPTDPGDLTMGIPAAEVSPLYASEKFDADFGVWSPEDVHLNSVIVAPILDAGEPLAGNNQVLTGDLDAVKTYPNQTVVDLANATVVTGDAEAGTFTVDPGTMGEGSYEVIALYSAPSGSYGLNSIIENTTTDKRNYVVDHLDPEAITHLVDGWLGEEHLNEIVNERDIRAAFNDSYEFYTDSFYNDVVQATAESGDVLGYDITRFIPSFYAFFQESFLIQGPPTVKDEYSQLGMNDLSLSAFGGVRPALLASGLTEDEAERVEYDYGRLLSSAFLDGMQAFSDTLGEYGILYRQQAYNPPLDTLGAAEFVDIPETEGLDEYSLKRISSGAHLFDKNLVTSEVFTLGSVPFAVTPQFMKQGFDLMATSGVNNFFYHGLSAPYSGNDDPAFTSDDDLFTEEGWRAWSTIGVEMADTAAISDYYGSLNAYASRANYVMQAGDASSDVAVYMPLFGALASGGGFGGGSTPLTTVTTLQSNGYAWDAINDDTIQTALSWDGEQLVANDGAASFDALVVESDTVPVETMAALQKLKTAGAPITFLDAAPTRQPGYTDGAYADADAQVAEIAAQMGGVSDAAGLATELAQLDAAPIGYATNDDVRFNRRTLDTGGELAYLRNTATDAAAPVELHVSNALPNCSWLDPETGRIFAADVSGGVASITLEASGAVILLCEPTGASFTEGTLSAGLPSSIDVTERTFVHELSGFTLSVTTDNLGGREPGAVQTAEFEGEVLGDWTAEGFLDGQLAHVTDAGTYRTEITVADASDYADGGAVLDLGAVHDAATVRVNPGTESEQVVQLYSAPYRVDIAPALVDGVNVVEVEAQPVKNNRRVGLKELYLDDPAANAAYLPYVSGHGTNALLPAGLVGPVTLSTAVESVTGAAVPAPTATSTPEPSTTPGSSAAPTAEPTATPAPQVSTTTVGSTTGRGTHAGLASTGADIAPILFLGGLLVSGGALLALMRRRRSSQA